MIHGFGGSPAELRPLAEMLLSDGWHTRGMLLPGFGPDIENLDSVGLNEWVVSAKGEWTEIANHYHPSVLLGYSMGAAVSIQLAKFLSPDSLILVAPYWYSPPIVPFSTSILKHIIRRIHPFRFANLNDARVRNYLRQLLPGTDLDDQRIQQLIRNELTIRLSTMDDVFRLGKMAYRDIASVNSPTLVIQGKNDKVVAPAKTRKLSQRISARLKTYVEIPAGHELLSENSGHLAEIHATIIKHLGQQLPDS